MANPNQQPRQASERQPTVNERYLDHDAILDAPSSIDELTTEVDRRNHDLLLTDILNYGEIYGPDPATGQLVITETIQPDQLKAAFWSVSQSVVNDPTSRKQGPDIHAELQARPANSYANLIVANHPHPETFLTMMHEQFAAANPQATEQQKSDFAKGLDQMGTWLYGQRYREYEEQRQDLHLLGAEASKDEHDQHNHEVALQILGTSYSTRRTIHKIANQYNDRTRAIQESTQTANNKAAKEARSIVKKLQDAEDKRIDKLHENNGKRANIDIKQAELDSKRFAFFRKTRERHYTKRRDKLDAQDMALQDAVDAHHQAHSIIQDEIRDRNSYAQEAARANVEAYREAIQQLSATKEAAIANRALRCELKGVSPRERQQRLAAFQQNATPEQIHRIARARVVEDAAARRYRSVSEQHRTTSRQASEHGAAARQLEQQIQDTNNSIATLEKKVNNLRNTLIPFAGKALQDTIEAIRTTDPTDPSYESLINQRDSHTQRLDQLQKSVENAEKTMTKLRARNAKLDVSRRQRRQQETDAQLQALDMEPERDEAHAAHTRQRGGTSRTVHKTNFNSRS